MKKLSEQFQDFERNEKDRQKKAPDITKYLDSDSEESIKPLKNNVKISEEGSS